MTYTINQIVDVNAAVDIGNINLSDNTISSTDTNGNIILSPNGSGKLGIGTTSPQAKVHINGGGNNISLTSGTRRYFQYNTALTSDSSTWSMASASLYASEDIVGSSWFVSLASTTFSDQRIKENILDVDDDQCLQKLRLLKPKQYTYKDTHKRGTSPVWGFIAQEVAETLEYAVKTMEKEIPNIYRLASVSSDRKTLTFNENIVLQDGEKRLMLKTFKDTEVRVLVSSYTANSITLEEPLEQSDITCEDIINEIFVYGQIVDDFHHLDKNAIFTVSVAALQEVDRRQTTDNERILELEGDLTKAQETIAIQAQDIATLKSQVAALMQHTGVTI